MILFAAGDKRNCDPHDRWYNFVIGTHERVLSYLSCCGYLALSQQFSTEKIVIYEPLPFEDLSALPNVFNLSTLLKLTAPRGQLPPNAAALLEYLQDQYLGYDLTDNVPKLRIEQHSLLYSMLSAECHTLAHLCQLLRRSDQSALLTPLIT